MVINIHVTYKYIHGNSSNKIIPFQIRKLRRKSIFKSSNPNLTFFGDYGAEFQFGKLRADRFCSSLESSNQNKWP